MLTLATELKCYTLHTHHMHMHMHMCMTCACHDPSSGQRVHRGVSIGQMLGVITIFAILVLFEAC